MTRMVPDHPTTQYFLRKYQSHGAMVEGNMIR